MTKTQRHAGRAIRNMIRAEAAMNGFEAAGEWAGYRQLGKIMMRNYNRARRLGVSESRLLRVGRHV